MAFEFTRLNNTNARRGIYTDVNKKDPNNPKENGALYTDYRKSNSVVTDAAAINNAIKNILFTKKGSLPGKPTFGSRIDEIVFNQIDFLTIQMLETFIQEALDEWEPRIVVLNVSVIEVPEYNKIIATIDYRYVDTGLDINEQISLNLTQ